MTLMSLVMGFFRTFPHGKKCGVPGRSVRTCPGTSAHGPRRLMSSPGGPMSRRWRWRRRMRSTGSACSSSISVLPTASHSVRLNTRLGVVGRAFLLLRRTLLGRGGRGRRGARGNSPSPLLVCGHGAVCKGSALALLFWCAVFSSVDDRPMMLDIMAGMDQEDTYMLVDFSLQPLVSGSLLFAVLLGSTVDTFYVSLQRLL